MSSVDETRPRVTLAPGSTVGVYQVLSGLGAGAMGEVCTGRAIRGSGAKSP